VLKGDLEDAIFAADFGDLVAGNAPKVYGNAKTFFQNTYPTSQLCKVCEIVFDRLAKPKEGGATVRLSTGFGGGKTHTLMALWHLAKHIADASMGTELLPAAGRPGSLTVVGVDAGKAGVPNFAKHGNTKVHSLHGEIFYQLGGAKALKSLGSADDPEKSPGDADIKAVFPKGPVLVLLDELVIYMGKLSERGQGNLMGFLNSLTSVVSKENAVLIVTDPARQVAYASQSAQLAATLKDAAGKLDDMFDRKVSDFDPIGDEAPRVIVRRLFEQVKEPAAEAASAAYHQLYTRVLEEQPGLLPASAANADYAKRIVECYPFHPRLLDTAQNRLGAMDDFQKSRGVLRLFARILRDVWEAKEDIALITGGDINWSSPRIQADLLQRLNRNRFKAAVSADVDSHAGELDGGAERGVHRRAASALLLESIPLQSNAGLEPSDLALAMLRPEDAGPEPSEALDRLLGVCWHTYPMAGGRGYQFRYEPNVIKQLEEHMSQVPREDAASRVRAEVQSYFSGFKLASWPDSAKDVPESISLQLVLCEDEAKAKSVCANADDTDPGAPMPRRFQNAILAVTATQSTLNEAITQAQRLIAGDRLEKEHGKGESGKLVREQLKNIKPELIKQFRLRACRAFDRVLFAGGVVHRLDEQYQVPDEQILQRPQGQACLRKFLDANDLIYQPGEALDTNRFVKNVLPGTTPLADNPDAYTAKAVYERFLSAPDLRLVPDGGVVRQTIIRAVEKGKLAVRTADGQAYDKDGCVRGQPGSRQRVAGETLTSFALDESVLVTLADSNTAKEWLKEDEIKKPGKKGETTPTVITPPELPQITATSWETILEHAPKRPLRELKLTAIKPSDATMLANLAQPFGADSLNLSVAVGGQFKKAGSANFAANDVDLNHPTKPLHMAQTLFNAMQDGSMYEATLALDFGAEGRKDVIDRLKQLSEDAPEELRPEATFGKPIGGTS